MADMANRNEVKVLLKTALLRTLNDNFNGLKSEIDIANFTDDMVTSNMDMDRETLSLTGLDGDEILYNDPLTKKKLYCDPITGKVKGEVFKTDKCVDEEVDSILDNILSYLPDDLPDLPQ